MRNVLHFTKNAPGRTGLVRALATVAILAAPCPSFSQQEALPMAKRPRVFCFDPTALTKTKGCIADGNETLRPALEKLRSDADTALKVKAQSVMDKTLTPPSGDKHDYMSFGPYWWPDPAKKDGLPYIRRDGEVNPESRQGCDSGPMGSMTRAVDALALAYYFTGKQAYAEHAALLLRTWFLDPATKMNPNLNFGQAIPGRTKGRGIGIIDTGRLAELVDSVGLLAGSAAWTRADQNGMVEWFDAYLNWLLTSKHGRREGRAKNNHGTWYDVQVASFALFVGKTDLAKQVVEAAKKRRIASQIEPDGRQPYELARTKSWGYSTMNLKGLFRLATLGERVGVDLWHYETPDGRGIRKALDYLAPYADPQWKWTHKQISRFNRMALYPLLLQAVKVYGADPYTALIDKLPRQSTAVSRDRLLYP